MLLTVRSTLRCPMYLTRIAPAPSSWQFDVTSALIGTAVALLLAGLAYRFRGALRLGWETVIAPFVQSYRRMQSSAEDQYRQRIARQARSLTIPRAIVPLDAVLVEPVLAAPPPLSQQISDVELMHAPPLTLPAGRMLGRHPRLIVLGWPGAGRTTLLAYLALACLPATDDGENGEIQKASAVSARLGETTSGPVCDRFPIYVLLPTVDWDTADDAEDNTENDAAEDAADDAAEPEDDGARPVERLLDAASALVGGSGGTAKALRRHLEMGQAIVLLDGWDELPPQTRGQAAAWLSELADALPENLWVVGTGARGYAPLTEVDFVPLKLLPWTMDQVETLARQWAETHTPSDEEQPVATHQVVTELRRARRAGASPAEMALRAFVYLEDGQAPAGRAALFDRALNLLIPQREEPWFSAACRAALGQVALTLQQEGRAAAGREEIEAATETTLPPLEERPGRAAVHVFRALTGERGLLHPVGPDRYAFTHSLWQAYLAARQLVTANPAVIAERLDDDRWTEVVRFYAELGDMKPLVTAWLNRPDNLFHTPLHVLSSWIAAAPKDAKWRDGAMAVLARTFLQPDQPAPVRQELAKALASTGMSGVTYFFKQALQLPDAGGRTAAALGLIQMADELNLDLIETFLEDDSPIVRDAAVRRLAHLEAEAAIRLLGRILLTGEDTLRQAAAEALAMRGTEGRNLLREATELEDVMARRATVFGLTQLKAHDLLEKMAREDEQWIVRSAASAALEELDQQEEVSGVPTPPQVGQFPWLISWAAAQGEGVGLGNAARHMLRRALNEGEPPIRLVATQALAQIGRPDDVESLRARLSDPDPAVATAALEALAEIGRRYDLHIT